MSEANVHTYTYLHHRDEVDAEMRTMAVAAGLLSN